MLPVWLPHRDIFGGVAQLGERTVRIRKVESSILFVSTKKGRYRFCGICLFYVDYAGQTPKKQRFFTRFA